jgi:hypothetical protein
MTLRTGYILVFKGREEVILKVSNNRMVGEVITDQETYSTDFMQRWIESGFVKVKKPKK